MVEPGTDDPEAFVSNLPLTAAFGTHPKTKILGAMLAPEEDPPTAFSASEISRIAGVDEAAVEEHVADLLDVGIVVEADEPEAGAYRLDEGSDVVAKIEQLNDDLAERVFRADG